MHSLLPLRNQPLRRVALFRALQLGDLLCAVPAFRALRAALPDARITLLGLPWARSFVERFRCYLDDFQEFPGYPGLPEQPPRLTEVPAFLSAMQQEGFDLVVQLHGSGVLTNPLSVLFGARHTAGCYQPGQYCPDPERFLPYPDDVHEVWRPLRLLEFLGFPLQGEHLEFPLFAEDEQGLQGLLQAEGLVPGGYVCLHPGARALVRRWPPERFAAVGDALAQRGLRIVLTGSREEAELTRAVASTLRSPSLNLAGRTSLGVLAALLRAARLLVCNNTGVAHVAAAVGAFSVVLFHEQGECDRWAPLDHRRHRAIVGHPHIDPREVLSEAEQLLGSGNGDWEGHNA